MMDKQYFRMISSSVNEAKNPPPGASAETAWAQWVQHWTAPQTVAHQWVQRRTQTCYQGDRLSLKTGSKLSPESSMLSCFKAWNKYIIKHVGLKCLSQQMEHINNRFKMFILETFFSPTVTTTFTIFFFVQSADAIILNYLQWCYLQSTYLFLLHWLSRTFSVPLDVQCRTHLAHLSISACRLHDGPLQPKADVFLDLQIYFFRLLCLHSLREGFVYPYIDPFELNDKWASCVFLIACS